MATLCQGGIVAVSWTYSETEIWNQGDTNPDIWAYTVVVTLG